jgi:hypothetical protein
LRSGLGTLVCWPLPGIGFHPVQLRRSKTAGILKIHEIGSVEAWIGGVALLNPNRPAAGIPPIRWRQFIDDCEGFLDPMKGVAERAFGMGWFTFDLFGCHPSQPLAYLGIAGLLWSVNGGRVIEIHLGWASITDANNGFHRTFEKRRPRQASLTLPWWMR